MDVTAHLLRIEKKLDQLLGQNAEPLPDWLTIEQAAKVSKLSEYTIRQACNRGRITDCFKNEDGRWRIAKAEAEKMRDFGLPRR